MMNETLIRATVFAAHKHRHQRRKMADAIPYINHPLDLIHILAIEAKIADINVLCGAVLHDTIEDTDTEYDDIEKLFGPKIADIVAEVTDDKTLPKAARKQAQIEKAPHASPEAKLVKLADKIANMRDMVANPPSGWEIARIIDYIAWSKEVVDRMRGAHEVLEKLFDAAYETARAAHQGAKPLGLLE